MAKIAVTFEPVFHLPLTPEDVLLIQHLALHHYDWRCIGAARVGGFIFGWRNMTRPPEPSTSVEASRDQIDVTLKVLELRRSGLLHGRDADLKRADELSATLLTAVFHWQHRQPAPIDIDTAVGFNLTRSAAHG